MKSIKRLTFRNGGSILQMIVAGHVHSSLHHDVCFELSLLKILSPFIREYQESMLKYTFHLWNKWWPFSTMARSGKCGVVLRTENPKGLWEGGCILCVAITCSWEMSASLSYWETRRSMWWMSISFANPFTRGEVWHTSYHWHQLLVWWITASSIVVTQELFAKRFWVLAIPCYTPSVPKFLS